MLKITTLLFTLLISSALYAQTVKLTTLNWPPYTEKSLKDLGFTSLIVTKAFEQAGYQVDIKIFPWKRAVKQGTTAGSQFSGVFPEYTDGCKAHQGLESNLIGRGPLAFIEKSGANIQWNSLSDLSQLKIGTVLGYANTPEFDKMAAEKKLKVKAAKDDLINLKKVLKGRINLAVIDENVFRYLQAQHPEFKSLKVNSKLLSEGIGLHICFRNDPKGKTLLKAFNQGLEKINIQEITDNYLKALLKN
ncbi:substrate-binding periplasmic protein [Piscirickettsia litoralis]|uniref:Solute-binding protein family 3/N-terminal domain-containing protein n=1 Tax=Piscirickettsia litoralis TaxID=1891921 RepID=A0ABX3A7C5_9GAMM|nr:transporter substrate-binding domain-containing protein [Piscirickettsia litoralis]ODN41984.1 hypothetical protein BGC07_02190 [Piscirickettsia litoralis]